MPRKLTSLDKRVIKSMSTMHNEDIRSAEEITAEYTVRLRANDDEATIILVGHLLIENLLDKIIQIKCKSPKTILSDSRSYTFAVKLQIIYSMGLLPDDTYKNIVRINKFRNKFAHTIEFIIDPSSMSIDLDDDAVSYLEFSPEDKKKKNLGRKYLDLLCFVTLEKLSKHMLTIDVDPRLISDLAS